jgi:hypothetical protein
MGRWLGPVLGGLVVLAGCTHFKEQTRLQSDEETERDRYQVATVGDKTQVGSPEPVPVTGVGLVEGLEGTGGDPGPENLRALVEDELRRQGERHIKELLQSPSTAVVLVSGSMPAGAHKGDPIDVEVSLPRGSRSTSLRGGRLRVCKLSNYNFAGNLSARFAGSSALLKGHPVVRAEGPVLVGLGGDDESRLRQGRIWGGGRCQVDSPLLLVMNPEQQFARLTALISDRINDTFQAPSQGPRGTGVAYTADNKAIYLTVPPQYRYNLPRFLRVVRLIPLQDAAEGPGGDGKHTYRQRLGEDLLDPARTVTAALRLEALGQHSVGTLKKGLESSHPLVRFCSAEALLYLGSPSGADEVARAVAEQPLFRAFGLTALASLDESVCQDKLADLLGQARDDETRYGAFKALITLDEHSPAIRGERLGDSFWLHRVAPASAPLVHVSTSRRAEVVLFGTKAFLRPPFWFMAGEFAVTAAAGDARCTISRFPLRGEPARRQCSLDLEEVLREMAGMGSQYPEAVALLQQANKCDCLSCRVRFDALPQAVSVYELVKAGKDAPGAASDLLPGGQDLGLTPTLYDTGLPAEPEAKEKAAPGPEGERP